MRIDFDRAATLALAPYETLRLDFLEPPGGEIRIDNPGRLDQNVRALFQGMKKDSPESSNMIAVGIDKIAEISVPFALLGVKVNDPLHFFVELLENKQSRDRAPREGTIQLMCPSPDFEQIMWDV